MLFNISDEAKALRMTEAKPEMKSVQIRSFFGSEKTLYLDTFHAVETMAND